MFELLESPPFIHDRQSPKPRQPQDRRVRRSRPNMTKTSTHLPYQLTIEPFTASAVTMDSLSSFSVFHQHRLSDHHSFVEKEPRGSDAAPNNAEVTNTSKTDILSGLRHTTRCIPPGRNLADTEETFIPFSFGLPANNIAQESHPRHPPLSSPKG